MEEKFQSDFIWFYMILYCFLYSFTCFSYDFYYNYYYYHYYHYVGSGASFFKCPVFFVNIHIFSGILTFGRIINVFFRITNVFPDY